MDALEKSIICCTVGLIIFGTGYWCGCLVSDDRDRANTVGGYIQSAQNSTTGAGEANRAAQESAEKIGDSNQTIRELVDAGEQILAGIRSRGEEDP